MRYLVSAVILIAFMTGCSRESDRFVAASPTSPTAAAVKTIAFTGGISGPMDVVFPGRNDSSSFRNDIETIYQTTLNRAPSTTYVDREGEVVWTQEYIRYRVNGCDHGTAVARVMTQIDSGPAGGICTAPPEGIIQFPSRADALQFRRELEIKYQQMGRALTTTFVDMEGAVIWIQEYLRYRINACDHATAASKVVSQIGGGPVAATCFVACEYALNPSAASVNYAPASISFEVRPNPGGCAWTVTSDASWLTFPSDLRNGSGYSTIPLTVAQNNSTSERTGRIRVAWSGGGATYTIVQRGIPFVASFTMLDPFRSGGAAATECWIRSNPTPCNFVVDANLPGGNYQYQWRISYNYGIDKVISQIVTTSTYSFSDSCGANGSSPDGPTVDLDVALTITDDRGNTISLRSNENSQPPLRVKLYTCS
jgi:hypothetical protein